MCACVCVLGTRSQWCVCVGDKVSVCVKGWTLSCVCVCVGGKVSVVCVGLGSQWCMCWE